MGGSDEQMVMVAGLAGGMGLSGNACGALGAAIWMNSLDWRRKQTDSDDNNPESSDKVGFGLFFDYPRAISTLKAFYDATDSEILCHKISGQFFKTIDDHTEFMKNGGCDKLVNVLARS